MLKRQIRFLIYACTLIWTRGAESFNIGKATLNQSPKMILKNGKGNAFVQVHLKFGLFYLDCRCNESSNTKKHKCNTRKG